MDKRRMKYGGILHRIIVGNKDNAVRLCNHHVYTLECLFMYLYHRFMECPF